MYFAIHSNRTLIDSALKEATLLIENGCIIDVVDGIPEGLDCPFENVGNSILMPGLVDCHVHINEPGRTEWEGFDTATKAAVAGGITTLVDMPLNSSPVSTTADAFQRKLAAAKEKLHIHCGFWGGVIPGNENHLAELSEMGVLGFKAFLVHSGIDEFPNVTESDLRKAIPIIAETGLPLLMHSELETSFSPEMIIETQYGDWLNSHPKKWEDDAIALMIKLCKEFNCKTHIVHLSSANSIEQIQKAKYEGLPLTVETCPHYLFFNAEEIPDGDTRFKCAPPIREKENNEQLWQALKDGIIDFVVTDHSPSTPELKLLESGNLKDAWGGISSLQFSLPVMWTAAKERGFSVQDISKWMSSKTADFIGFSDKKGKIAKGFDADLVVWNPERKFVVETEAIQFRHKITPYEGQELVGVVEKTFVKGEKVFDNGAFISLQRGEILLTD